jgi:hypothetical protein
MSAARSTASWLTNRSWRMRTAAATAPSSRGYDSSERAACYGGVKSIESYVNNHHAAEDRHGARLMAQAAAIKYLFQARAGNLEDDDRTRFPSEATITH